MADEDQPIIVKKIVKGHAGHHGGAWKVAYADFVTAMMALFMVLWILSQGPEVRNQVAAYFTDPRGIQVIVPQPGTSVMDNVGVGMMDGLPSPTQPMMKDGEGTGPQHMAPAKGVTTEKETLEEAGKRLMKQIMAQPELSKLSNMVHVEVTQEGLRIELQDRVEGTFFESGSAQPSAVLDKVLTEVAGVLMPLDNEVAIEGHTDAHQYGHGLRGYSNWELSSDRGNAVRKMMVNKGFPPSRVAEVRAFADRRPLDGTDPFDGRNRRISLLVKSKEYFAKVEDEERPDTSGVRLEKAPADPSSASGSGDGAGRSRRSSH